MFSTQSLKSGKKVHFPFIAVSPCRRKCRVFLRMLRWRQLLRANVLRNMKQCFFMKRNNQKATPISTSEHAV